MESASTSQTKTPGANADEVQELEDERYGKVRLQRWNDLRDQHAPGLSFDLLRAQIHLEKDKPPSAVWFIWLPPVNPPVHITITTQLI